MIWYGILISLLIGFILFGFLSTIAAFILARILADRDEKLEENSDLETMQWMTAAAVNGIVAAAFYDL